MLDEATNPILGGGSTSTWHRVCSSARLTDDRGVCALIEGIPVAVFRLTDGSIHAVSGTDPCCAATVISRGLIGSVGGCAVVISPMYKQRFDLASGVCLDDPSVALDVFAVRCVEGVVEVSIS